VPQSPHQPSQIPNSKVINTLFASAVEHHARGRLSEAMDLYDTILKLDPNAAGAHCNRGILLHSVGRFDEAIRSYDCAIRIQPNLAEAFNSKANALHDSARSAEALPHYDRALALKPGFAEAYHNKGKALHALKRWLESVECYDRAISLNPDYADAYYNKGNALQDLQRSSEALQCYDRGIALRPNFAEAFTGRGNALTDLKRLDEALASYDRAIGIRGEFPDAYWDKGICLLLAGRFDEGWPFFEWRKKRAVESPSYPQPTWTGKENLEGRTLFVYAEQGLGDTIQFSRYAVLAQEKGAKVTFAVQHALMRLLKSLGSGIVIESLAAKPAAFDNQIALMSLPMAFGTRLNTCPAAAPYLRAEPERVAKWKRQLGMQGFKIGICWQGNKQADIDVGRSFPVRHFEAIAQLPDVRLVSLQKYDGVEQLRDLPHGMKIETLGEDFDAGPDSFVDTAAVMECLDLIITSDTAVAHLAGALGRPAWVVLKYVPDWRWMLDRPDSPWYPTLRLFRQPRPEDWSGVFASMEAQLNCRPQLNSATANYR
jgi:tetratricopeptide (TPR) repeat protein